MFEVGKKYKLEITNSGNPIRKSITYTGTVRERTDTHIMLETIRNEAIILLIKEIVRSEELHRGFCNEGQ